MLSWLISYTLSGLTEAVINICNALHLHECCITIGDSDADEIELGHKTAQAAKS